MKLLVETTEITELDFGKMTIKWSKQSENVTENDDENYPSLMTEKEYKNDFVNDSKSIWKWLKLTTKMTTKRKLP